MAAVETYFRDDGGSRISPPSNFHVRVGDVGLRQIPEVFPDGNVDLRSFAELFCPCDSLRYYGYSFRLRLGSLSAFVAKAVLGFQRYASHYHRFSQLDRKTFGCEHGDGHNDLDCSTGEMD